MPDVMLRIIYIISFNPQNKFRNRYWFLACVCVCVCVFLIFWPYCTACGILVPQPGIKLMSPALEEQSLKHCTTGEVPIGTIFIPLTHFTAFWILFAWIPLPNPFLAYLGPTLYPRTLLSPGFCLGLDNRRHHRRLRMGEETERLSYSSQLLSSPSMWWWQQPPLFTTTASVTNPCP